MKKIIILLLFPLISQAQDTLYSGYDREDIEFRSEMHQAGIYLVGAGMFIDMGFRAMDIDRWEAHATAGAFSAIGLVMALTNWKYHTMHQKINLQPTPNGVGLVYRF